MDVGCIALFERGLCVSLYLLDLEHDEEENNVDMQNLSVEMRGISLKGLGINDGQLV